MRVLSYVNYARTMYVFIAVHNSIYNISETTERRGGGVRWESERIVDDTLLFSAPTYRYIHVGTCIHTGTYIHTGKYVGTYTRQSIYIYIIFVSRVSFWEPAMTTRTLLYLYY